MILEHALVPVKPELSQGFESAFRDATPIIASMPGFQRLRLSRCTERPEHYLLLVEWDSLEDHTVGFRGSPEFQEWRRRLNHFYDPPAVVEHYATITTA